MNMSMLDLIKKNSKLLVKNIKKFVNANLRCYLFFINNSITHWIIDIFNVLLTQVKWDINIKQFVTANLQCYDFFFFFVNNYITHWIIYIQSCLVYNPFHNIVDKVPRGMLSLDSLKNILSFQPTHFWHIQPTLSTILSKYIVQTILSISHTKGRARD